MLCDSKERLEATNPKLSFIVQAPAGSGKTELLTQRYLRLLSTVQAPEHIVALTFTRKAANEMRERIILALQKAARNEAPNSAHQQKTLEYARQALEHGDSFQWNLIHHPNRLKIITIDSLCQMINYSIPLSERHMAYANITNKPQSHYAHAARLCIQYAINTPDYQSAIKTLLIHVDNRQDLLISLFQKLLAQRDEWLPSLFQAKTQDKSIFECALGEIEANEIKRLQKSLPSFLSTELVSLSRELALSETNARSPRFILRTWHDFNCVDSSIAKALSRVLLTGNLHFRKRFDHHVGLSKAHCAPEIYKKIKEQSTALLAQLHEYPDFSRGTIARKRTT